MRNSPLRYVDLNQNSIGAEGAQAIGSALGTSKVEFLDLYRKFEYLKFEVLKFELLNTSNLRYLKSQI